MTKLRALWGACFLAALILALLDVPVWIGVIALVVWLVIWFRISYHLIREMMQGWVDSA